MSGLMNSIGRGISNAAYAGADYLAKSSLEEQRAKIQLERDLRLEEAGVRAENRSEERKSAPLNRIAAAAKANMAEESPSKSAPAEVVNDVTASSYTNSMDQASDKTAGLINSTSPTRKRTAEEALALAREQARVNDPVAYLASAPLVDEKTLTVGDGATIIDKKTGKVIFQNTGKVDREERREDRRDSRASEAEDARDRRQQNAIDAAERRANKTAEDKAQGKPLPISAAKALLDNQTNLRRAQTALALASGETVDGLKGDTDATGKKGWVPNQVLNRMDPAGVDTRAAIADLGSLVIHDRSGAAVTASEFPRLAPFIPTEKDDAATVKKKLTQFTRNYQAVIDDTTEFYRSSGYKVPIEVLKSGKGDGKSSPASPAIQVQTTADVEALPSGSIFTTPDGKTRRKP